MKESGKMNMASTLDQLNKKISNLAIAKVGCEI